MTRPLHSIASFPKRCHWAEIIWPFRPTGARQAEGLTPWVAVSFFNAPSFATESLPGLGRLGGCFHCPELFQSLKHWKSLRLLCFLPPSFHLQIGSGNHLRHGAGKVAVSSIVYLLHGPEVNDQLLINQAHHFLFQPGRAH